MSRSLSLDFLVVSTATALHLPTFVAVLEAMHPGVVTVTATATEGDIAPRPGLERVTLGRVTIHETLGRADATFIIERHLHPVMSGLAPAALDRLLTGVDAASEAIMRGGTLSVDVHANGSGVNPLWSLEWLMALMARVAGHIGGIIFDPAAHRCLTPASIDALRPGDALSYVTLHSEHWGPEMRWLHTHGLQQFGQPELEFVAVPQSLEENALGLLRTIVAALAQNDVSDGPSLRTGMRIDCEGAGWLTTWATHTNPDHHAAYGRLRLTDDPQLGQPHSDNANMVIAAAALGVAQEAIADRAWALALREIDRVLAFLPDHSGALALKGRLYLAQGAPQDALDVGAFLTLLAPRDRRGHALIGMALMALGRPGEAWDAFNQAILLDPDDPELFESRSRVAERLGRQRDAAADHARAAILRR